MDRPVNPLHYRVFKGLSIDNTHTPLLLGHFTVPLKCVFANTTAVADHLSLFAGLRIRIRIQSGQWIRIRDPESESGSRRAKMTHKVEKNL